MKLLILAAIFFCGCQHSTDAKPNRRLGRYLIVSPRVFRNGSTEKISATFFDLTQTVEVGFQLFSGYGKRKQQIDLPGRHIVEAKDKGMPKILDVQVPGKIRFGSTTLRVNVKTLGGYLLHTEGKYIDVQEYATTLFIQSDKAIYKPGEKVRFRVIAVKPDLKPLEGKLEEVYVKSPSSRMMQWKNVSLDTGFASFAMKLSRKPLLGNWWIEAKYAGKIVKKSIKVDKYVLPKIEVSIAAPKSLLFRRDDFDMKLCAMYTYGKPAAGKMTVTTCLKRKYRRRREKFECSEVTKPIKGCKEFVIRYKELKNLPSMYGYLVTINASFVESGTNLVFTGQHNITKIVRHDVKLSFDGTPDTFKPGFPAKVQLRVTTNDGRPIIGDSMVKLKITNATGSFTITGIVKNGYWPIVLATSNKLQYINLRAEYMEQLKDSKKRSKMFRGKKMSWTSSWSYSRPSSSKRMKSWYSPTENYLVIRVPENPLKVPSNAKIQIEGFGDDITGNSISYMVFCRGDNTVTGNSLIKLKPGRALEATIRFKVNPLMVPKCRLLVYYVRKNGEFVGDSAIINIEETYENQVSVQFLESQRKPGQKVKIEVKADTGSRFALSAVDKSVQLLAKNNDLKSSDVISILASQDVGSNNYWSYRSYRSKCPNPWYRRRGRRSIYFPYFQKYVDGTRALQESGAVYFSNLDIDVTPCIPQRPYYMEDMEHSIASAKASPGASPKEGQPGPPIRRPIMNRRPPIRRKKKPSKNKEPAIVVRKHFPETWLWLDDKVTASGTKIIESVVPDTMTTWYANLFAISKTSGLGVAKRSSLLAFQPFFVSLALPYAVIRGEKVEIPATIFNYMDLCLAIKLTIEKSDDYDIAVGPEFDVCACSDKSVTKRFKIVPKKLGSIPILVKAVTTNKGYCANMLTSNTVAADAISKKLLVEAEGIKKESTYNAFICLKDTTKTYKEMIRLDLPPNYVPGSVYATFSVFGDLMGPSLTNLDKLLLMPSGCGEQNMLNFAPNIYILDYLKNSGQLTGVIEQRAKEYMRIGYQRELTYRRTDQSYSAFGNRDKEGSTWLTAFVTRSYGEAKRYIDIDDQDITGSRAWLLSLQKSDGCFKDVGMLHHRDMKGGVRSGKTMSAFVLIALLETGMTKSDDQVNKALQCITKDLSSVTDPYTVTILAYTLTLADSPKKMEIMSILKRLAISQDGMTHWESATAKKDEPGPWYMHYQARSADIEMTAYALMAYLKTESYINSIPIIRWLAKQRNSLGGFASTQDTCVALQALSKNARKTTAKGNDLSIDMKSKGIDHTFTVNEGNKLLLQRVELPTVPTVVNVSAKGLGCALIQTNVKFNEQKEKKKPAFTIRIAVNPDGVAGCRHKLKICAKYNSGTSNMAMIDVQMVSGFEPVTEDLDKILQSTENLLLKDYEFEGNLLSLYFNEIGEAGVCVQFAMEEKQRVEDRKPAPIKVYDYYDTAKSATEMHNVGKCKSN